MSGIYRGPNGSATADALNIDGDKGDLTVSNSGIEWTINTGVVDTTKLGGDITTAGKALLDDADATAQRATLGLGNSATATIGTDVLAFDSNLQDFVDTFSLPTTDGSNGFVLTTDGLGNLSLTSPGGIPDGGKGDITISSGGTIWTVDNDAITTSKILDDNVTYAKIQNVSATDKLLGRVSSGAGDIEEITCTSAGRALLDDVDASAQRTTLGLGTISLQGDGDKGDITVSSSGGTWTIDNDAVTFTKMQNIATSRLLGRSTAGSGDVEELSVGDGLGFSAGVLTTTGLTKILQGTAVATTSGTAIDFTGIPSWAKRVTLMLNDVSLSGTDNILIQIGDSGGIETTGYISSTTNTTSTVTTTFTTAAIQVTLASAGRSSRGIMSFVNMTGNVWVFSGCFNDGVANAQIVSGAKTLSDVLTQIRVTRSGTDTFDSGSVNILVEG